MEEQIVITSGNKYIDIDAYAGIFAYRKLLKHMGYSAYAYTSAPTNESVSDLIKELGFTFDSVDFSKPTKYILLDVSNPQFFDAVVKENDILEIIDHHTGFEEYWKEKQVPHTIEFIGSICTIIFEMYEKNHLENLLDSNLCKLLMAGILDNTLNLKGSITSKRDEESYFKLQKLGQVDENWRMEYFESCYAKMENHLSQDVASDIKIEKVSDTLPEVIGQIIVLDKEVIFRHQEEVKAVFQKYPRWILNVIALKDGKSYIFYGSEMDKVGLEQLFHQPIEKEYLLLEPFLLRKQIMKTAREQKQK